MGKFVSKIIYKNPNFNCAYDIALLEVDDSVPVDFYAECDINKPSKSMYFGICKKKLYNKI